MTNPQEPVARQVLAGAQMLFVAFGALVLMPLITGMDPNVALFTAGLGTLLFQLVTRRQVPVFLASSFAFIAPIIAAKGEFGLPAVLGGVVAAGLVYVLLGFAVRLKGPGFIDRLLPPVVIAPVIVSIGLALSPVAVNMAMGKAGDGSAQLIPYHTAMLICARVCSAWCRFSPGSPLVTGFRSSSAWSTPAASPQPPGWRCPTSLRRSSTSAPSCSWSRSPWPRRSSTLAAWSPSAASPATTM